MSLTAAQYVVLISLAEDLATLAGILEQASEHLTPVEYEAIGHHVDRRERELGRVFET